MDDEKSVQSERDRIEAERSLELAILATLLEDESGRMGEDVLMRRMTVILNTTARVEAVCRALDGLVAVGLIRRDSGQFEATPAAQHLRALGVGL
jgi:hypothetical protein